MLTLMTWLAADATRARLAELIAVNNGSLEVQGQVGQVIQCTVNRYGRLGLTIDEAFELTYLRGMFDALVVGATATQLQEAKAWIGREISGITIVLPTADQMGKLLCK